MKFFAIIAAWLLPLAMITAPGESPTYRLAGVGLLFGALWLTRKWFGSDN